MIAHLIRLTTEAGKRRYLAFSPETGLQEDWGHRKHAIEALEAGCGRSVTNLIVHKGRMGRKEASELTGALTKAFRARQNNQADGSVRTERKSKGGVF